MPMGVPGLENLRVGSQLAAGAVDPSEDAPLASRKPRTQPRVRLKIFVGFGNNGMWDLAKATRRGKEEDPSLLFASGGGCPQRKQLEAAPGQTG